MILNQYQGNQASTQTVDILKWYNNIKDRLTTYTKQLFIRSDKERLKELADKRQFKIEVLEGKEIFYINRPVELLIPEFTNELVDFGIIKDNKPIYHQRWVIPIRDTDNKVISFVGYSIDSKERYMYATSKVYLRRDTLYNLENLNKAYKDGYGILCEGITDAIALQSLGYTNVFANCGTFRSALSIQQLSRCKDGIIKIPDRDKAGKMANEGWNFKKSIKINVPVQFKDIDEAIRESNQDNKKEIKRYIDYCIEHIQSNKFIGEREITITL